MKNQRFFLTHSECAMKKIGKNTNMENEMEKLKILFDSFLKRMGVKYTILQIMHNKKIWMRNNKLMIIAIFMLLSLITITIHVPTVEASHSAIIIDDVDYVDEFAPGESTIVTITLRNNGGLDAANIMILFQNTEQLSVIGSNSIHIRNIDSWREKEIEVTVFVHENVPMGVYLLPIIITWDELTTKSVEVGTYVETIRFSNNTTLVKTIPKTRVIHTTIPRIANLGINFNVIGEPLFNIGQVITNPLNIKPDDENVKVRVFIENQGDGNAENVEVFLNVFYAGFKPSWSGTDRVHIGRLNHGDVREVIFHIDIPEGILPGKHSIPITILYRDSNGQTREFSNEIQILIEPIPNLKIISYHTEPTKIEPGTKTLLHLRIKNVGDADAEFVSIRATGVERVPFDFEVQQDFIGTLAPNKEGTAVLSFIVEDDALPIEYLQRVEIRHIDDGNVRLSDETLRINISQTTNNGSAGIKAYISVGFVVFIAIAGIFIFYMKKRKTI